MIRVRRGHDIYISAHFALLKRISKIRLQKPDAEKLGELTSLGLYYQGDLCIGRTCSDDKLRFFLWQVSKDGQILKGLLKSYPDIELLANALTAISENAIKTNVIALPCCNKQISTWHSTGII